MKAHTESGGYVSAAPLRQPALSEPIGVGLVGGGRWARTIASVLTSALPERSRIVWVSPGNHAGIRLWADKAALPTGVSLSIHSDMTSLLSDEGVRHVCIANAAADHVATALAVLNAGKNVLVEKPLSLNLKGAQEVVAAAARQRLIAGVGHVFLFARYLHRFSERLKTLGALSSVRLVWHDAVAERRDDEIKSFDASISVVEDVMPHVWSILRVLFPDATQVAFRGLDATRAGATVTISMEAAGTVCVAELARDSDCRRRLLRVESERGVAELDFTAEPGVMRLDGRTENADPQWLMLPRPLRTEIAYFLGLPAHEPPRHPFAVGEAIDAVRLSEECQAIYEAAQASSCVAMLRSKDANVRALAAYGVNELVQRHRLVRGKLSVEDTGRMIDGLIAALSNDLQQTAAAPSHAELVEHLSVKLRKSGRLAPP